MEARIFFISYILLKEFERVLINTGFDISITKAIEQINKIYEVIIYEV
jgi:CRISPR/Cas system-associated exonuclease Cas4 (RecB family)